MIFNLHAYSPALWPLRTDLQQRDYAGREQQKGKPLDCALDTYTLFYDKTLGSLIQLMERPLHPK